MDDLQVLSENTVATALASWVAADPSGGREEAGPALLRHLRLHHLTQAYIGGVLLGLPGVGKHVTAQQLAAVAQYSKASASTRASARGFQDFRHARPAPASSQLVLEWQVPIAALRSAVQHCLGVRQPSTGGQTSVGIDGWAMQGPGSFYNGFKLTLVTVAAHGALQAVAVALLATVEAASGLPQEGCMPADLSGLELQVCRAEWFVPDGLVQAPFVVGAERRAADGGPGEVAACQLRLLDVGLGAVHDTFSLLAALQQTEHHVTAVRPDKVEAAARRARLLGPRDQKVLLRCFVDGCQ